MYKGLQSGVAFMAALLMAGSSLAAELTTVAAESQPVDREILLDGSVEAVRRSTVSAQTSGQVQEINFDVDDYVTRGEVIVQLKDTEQRARLTQAEADLKAAAAQLTNARDEYERVKGVYEKKAISKSSLDKAAAELKTARARQQAAEAAVEQATEQLEYTRIRAPYSGIVTERFVQLGETANAGQQIMSGISLDELRVIVEVPQNLIAAVREQGKGRVQTPDGQWLEAERLTVFPFADRTANSFQVRLYLPKGTPGLFPGMFLKTAFSVGQRTRLVVPAGAVVYRSEVTGVYVVDAGGRVSLRHIRVGRVQPDGMIEVLAGLDAGEQVALDPIAAGVELKRQRQEPVDG